MNSNKKNFEENFSEGLEEERSRPFWLTLLLGGIAVFVLISFVWWSGFYQAFFYRKTPPIQEKKLESITSQVELVVPLNVMVLQNNGDLGSKRDEANVRLLIENASNTWAQADISLRVTSIHFVGMEDETINALLQDHSRIPGIISEYDPETFNVILVRKLGGINGIALGAINTLMVADLTTVYDFRATAHEVGHLLGLSHTDESRNRLMYRGANGTELTEEEIRTARDWASRL